MSVSVIFRGQRSFNRLFIVHARQRDVNRTLYKRPLKNYEEKSR